MLVTVAVVASLVTSVVILVVAKPQSAGANSAVRPPRSAPVVPTQAPAPAATATRAPAPAAVPATSVRPTAVPTAAPPPVTVSNSVLRIGETWAGRGLSLRSVGPAHYFWGECNTGWDCAGIDFEVQNTSGSTLNFEVPAGAFYLELSSGKRFVSNNGAGFNNFSSGSTQKFTISFRVRWGDFEAAKRDRSITYYIVGVQQFNDRIPEAKWREEVNH